MRQPFDQGVALGDRRAAGRQHHHDFGGGETQRQRIGIGGFFHVHQHHVDAALQAVEALRQPFLVALGQSPQPVEAAADRQHLHIVGAVEQQRIQGAAAFEHVRHVVARRQPQRRAGAAAMPVLVDDEHVAPGTRQGDCQIGGRGGLARALLSRHHGNDLKPGLPQQAAQSGSLIADEFIQGTPRFHAAWFECRRARTPVRCRPVARARSACES